MTHVGVQRAAEAQHGRRGMGRLLGRLQRLLKKLLLLLKLLA